MGDLICEKEFDSQDLEKIQPATYGESSYGTEPGQNRSQKLQEDYKIMRSDNGKYIVNAQITFNALGLTKEELERLACRNRMFL